MFGIPYYYADATINYVVDIGSDLEATAVTDPDPFGTYPNSNATASFTGSVNTPIGSCSWLLRVRHLSAPLSAVNRVEGTLSSYGDSDSYGVNGSGASIDASGGQFSMSCPCHICVFLLNPQTGTGDKKEFWNLYEDSPPNTTVLIRVYPRPNATTTGTLSLAGMSLSVSGNVGPNPAPLTIAAGYSGNLHVNATSLGGIGSASASGSGSVSLNSASTILTSALNGLSVSQSSSNGNASSQTNIEGYNLSGTSSVGGFDGGTEDAVASRTFYGLRTANLSGIIAHPWPGPNATPIAQLIRVLLTGAQVPHVDTTTGLWSATVSQDQAFQSVSANSVGTTTTQSPVTGTSSVNTYSPVAAELQGSSLSALGDDPTARRHMFHGKRARIGNASLSSSLTIDSGGSATPSDITHYDGNWGASSGWSAVSTSGSIVLSGTGGGSATRSFNTGGGYFANYRYLRLQIESDAPSTIELKVNSLYGEKKWPLTLSGAGAQTLFVDLMLPLNPTVRKDTTTTRYIEDADQYPQEGPFFGVGRCSSLVFDGLDSGVTYSINSIAIVRHSVTTGLSGRNGKDYLSLLGSLGYMPKIYPDDTVSEVGTTTEFFGNMGIWLQPDGTGNALQEYNLKKQVTTGGFTGTVTTTYHHQTFNTLAARCVPRYPGVSITQTVDSTPSGDPHPPMLWELYNADAYLAWGFGNALQAPEGTAPWKIGTDLDFDDLMELELLGDTLGDWPAIEGNCDWFEKSALTTTDRPLTMRFGTIQREFAAGEIDDNNRAPVAGQTVNIEQASVNRGSGTSSSTGWYETHAPSAQNGSTTALFNGQSAAFTSFTRRLQRLIWSYRPATGGGRDLAISRTSRIVLGEITEDGELSTRRWDGLSFDAAVVASSPTDVSAISLLWREGYTGGSHLLAGVVVSNDGQIWRSDDDGRTWSHVITLGPGSDVALCGSSTNITHSYRVGDDGHLYMTKYDSRDTDLVGTKTVVDSSATPIDVSSVGLGAIWDPDRQLIVLTYLDSGGTGIVATSRNGWELL